MTALDELLTIISNFTPEQLEKFLSNNLTQSILQAEEVNSLYLQEEPLCG